MFPHRYFANPYFTNRYFPESQGEFVPPVVRTAPRGRRRRAHAYTRWKNPNFFAILDFLTGGAYAAA